MRRRNFSRLPVVQPTTCRVLILSPKLATAITCRARLQINKSNYWRFSWVSAEFWKSFRRFLQVVLVFAGFSKSFAGFRTFCADFHVFTWILHSF